MSEAFDIVKFRDFCAGKPAGEEYDYFDRKACPCFQYLRDSGRSVDRVLGFHWIDTNGDRHPLPAALHEPLASGDVFGVFGANILSAEPTTFSALASRLSALIREGGNV